MSETDDFDLGGLDPVSERLVALVLRILAGDFSARGQVTGKRDGLDALTVALNMLAESFQLEHRARAGAEALLADAVDSYDLAPDALCSCEVGTLRLVKCNLAMSRALGRSTAELLGRSLLDFVSAGSRPVLARNLELLTAEAHAPSIDVELQSPDGPRIASVTGAVKRSEAGLPVRLLLSLRDETVNRRMASQLVQAHRLDALGRLAGGVAHDFNNLLLVIIASADLLGLRLADRPRELEEVLMVRDAAERGAMLTRDLLSFARHDSAPMSELELDGLVRRSESLLSRLVRTGVQIDLDLDAPGATIVAGPGHVGQVLTNLVANARDAMPDGGRIEIGTRLRRITHDEEGDGTEAPAGDYVELRVRDDGPGIPPEVRERIFEPFFSTKPMGRGTGLGLSIVYGIVRQAGGHVLVLSRPGSGTTFTILFPRAGMGVAAESTPPVEPREGARILLIEDDDLVRRLTARILRTAGYEVLEASSGSEALEVCRAHRASIALVVSDVVMPGMDGLQTLEGLRREDPRLPCIFVTGFAQEEVRLRGLPGVAVLHKPFASEVLLSAVREMRRSAPAVSSAVGP